MCCIMPRVGRVSDTNLFARLTGSGSQLLVYQMTFEAKEPVAMILPIPVALPTRERAVRFIDLKDCPAFFSDLNAGFPLPHSVGCASLMAVEKSKGAPLPVEVVGDFIASFVPSPGDFRRVDRRFKLPEKTFEALPQYNNYGFVVFQFKKLGGTPHPMAFEFPTRLTNQLFFPTVHIHDGQIHDKEEFDHTLYLQEGGAHGDESSDVAGKFIDPTKTKGIVRGELSVRRLKMGGLLPNTDVLLDTRKRDFGKAIWPGIGVALLGGYLYKKHRSARKNAAAGAGFVEN
jgi:hypothetical protein